MSYTMADFQDDYTIEHFKDLTPEERREALRSVPVEEWFADLSPKERRVAFGSLPPEDRLVGLSPEELRVVIRNLPPDDRRMVLLTLLLEERLASLSPAAIAKILRMSTSKTSSRKRKPRNRR